MAKARDWCFTYFGERAPSAMDSTVTYLVYQREMCPDTRRLHWQGYAEFKSPKAIAAAQKSLDVPGAHFEKRRGTPTEAAEYCMKEESRAPDGNVPVEYGERKADPQPGKRTDLEAIKAAIDDGKTDEEMWEEMFGTMAHSYKAVAHYRDLKARSKVRTWMTKGLWYWGPTGVGKSHTVFSDYDPATHYVMEAADKGWWDAYDGQEIVIINDFRGEIKYAELLTLIDKWPKKVPRRCREPASFVAKEIRITSSMPPDQVYSGIAERESIEQLTRRLEIIKLGQPFTPVSAQD